MKNKIVALFLAVGLMVASVSAQAEDRLVAGYSFPAVSYADGVWAVDLEKDLGKLGNVTVVADAGFANRVGADFADTAWTAGLGVQLPLSEKVLLKAGVTRAFVADVEDVDALTAGLVYQGDAWRFAGDIVKAEGVDAVAYATAERKILGNLALGVGSQFDTGEYYGTTVFASYSF